MYSNSVIYLEIFRKRTVFKKNDSMIILEMRLILVRVNYRKIIEKPRIIILQIHLQ